jgi:hypothetical protein
MEQTEDDRTESEILLLADDPPANKNITSSESHNNSDPKPTTRGGLPLILYKNYWFVPHHDDVRRVISSIWKDLYHAF